MKPKDKVEPKLKQKSNFNLNPNQRPHELNSFFDTYTKLDSIKTKLIQLNKDSSFSIADRNEFKAGSITVVDSEKPVL